ncbi:hypothetical protein ACVGWD_21965, partial [Enterobacter asburiae]
PGQSAALLGTAAAMSSTAEVTRQLADPGELTTPHGRSSIAVLGFQAVTYKNLTEPTNEKQCRYGWSPFD